MNITLRTTVATLALAMAACDVETNSTVYLSDLQAVADTGEAMTAPAVIAVEMPAVSTCEEKGGEVVPILNQYLHEATNPRCEQAGMNARLVLDFKAPLIPQDGQFTGAAALMVVPVEGTGTALFAGLNKASIDAMVQAAKDKHMPIGGTPDITMSVVLVNDTRDDAAMQISQVFLAGQAVATTTTITVAHRDQARLTLSNVASAAASAGQYVNVATLLTGPAE